ncbi:hypothetical protein G6F40_015068 [Rhizopus arrhizus]|nr:hypothetical protein G6F40_015068 [Rhizopus arrhizus]
MMRFSPRAWLPSGRALAVVPPFAWLVLFLLLPFLLVLKISFAEVTFGIPPYTALAEFKDEAPVFQDLPELGEDRRHHHADLRADRLPHRVLHRPVLAPRAQPVAAGRDPAVLDVVAVTPWG